MEYESDGGGAALTRARVELARRLRTREAELREAVFVHVRSTVPDVVADTDTLLGEGLRETIAVCVDSGLASIEQGARWSGAISPAVAVQARRNASSGVALTTSLRRCVAGYTLVWKLVLDEVSRHDLPEDERHALLVQASGAASALLAGVQAEIAEAHSTELKRGARSREQRCAEVAHRLLAGEALNAGELAELGYDLDGWHLGLIASAAPPGSAASSVPSGSAAGGVQAGSAAGGVQAGSAMRGLAAGLGCELLALARGETNVWAWLGGRRRVAFADLERILAAGQYTELSLAIGEPARGIEGWRQTHNEAQGALLVARCWPRPLTRYLDVAPEATALRDEALADSLIEMYLAPLDGMRIGGQAARRTLGALMEKGHNVSSAASALSIDRSTVHRQRNEIERRLGCRLHERRVEIELALRIEGLHQRRADDGSGTCSTNACC